MVFFSKKNIYTIGCVIGAVIIIYLIVLYFENNSIEGFSNNGKRNIWMYWENKSGVSKPPGYIQLCFDTVKRKCGKTCNLHILNERTVKKYLPDLRKDLDDKLNIPQKVDYYRYHLLHKYGGMWIDADTIIMRDLSPLFDKLRDYDYLGWGCQYKDCRKTGYPKPSIWFMVSRKGTKLIKKCIDNCDTLLDRAGKGERINYFELGRVNLWKCIQEMKKEKPGWDYYHFDSECFERDSNDVKLRNERWISNEKVDKKCIRKSYFHPIYNTAPGFPKWFKVMSKNQILKGNFLISKLFRRSLLES